MKNNKLPGNFLSLESKLVTHSIHNELTYLFSVKSEKKKKYGVTRTKLSPVEFYRSVVRNKRYKTWQLLPILLYLTHMCYGLTINTIHFSQLTHIIKYNLCITEKNRQFHSDLHRLFTANLVRNIGKYFFGKFDLGLNCLPSALKKGHFTLE